MLHNRFAGDICEKLKRFYDAGIPMNSQIVLCKGINDGKELDRTIEDLGRFLPYMESLSIVPVGLTRFREGLTCLEPFTKEDARDVLKQIHRWQEHFRKEYGTAFVHASDEWFILAGEDFPPEEYYEGYGQLENGVGMMRLLISEVEEALDEMQGDNRERELSIATAKLAYPTICMLTERIREKYPNIVIRVYCIENHFFGEMITVTGLLTGQDIIKQLSGKKLGERLLLPGNMLKADEDIFLDDITLNELSTALQVPVNIIKSEGEDLVKCVTQ